MIPVVRWLPPNVAKRWPEKTHHIPLKNIPVEYDDHMKLDPQDIELFLEEDEKKLLNGKKEKNKKQKKKLDDNNNNSNNSNNNNNNNNDQIQEESNTQTNDSNLSDFLQFDDKNENEDIDMKSQKSDKDKIEEDENKNDENNDDNDKSVDNIDNEDNNDSNNDNIDEENDNNNNDEENDNDNDDNDDDDDDDDGDDDNDDDEEEREDAYISDPEKFAEAVMQGYDDEPDLDFLSRIGGLQSGLAIGPASIDYPENLNKNNENKDDINNNDNDNADSEISDIEIRPTDEIFITCGTDEYGESYSLQVHIFDTRLKSIYIHHDILLPSFPLCSCWLSLSSTKSNLLAIGSVSESIEIFNLDTIDSLEPVIILGGRNQLKNKNNDLSNKLLASWMENIDFEFTGMTNEQKDEVLGELKYNSHSDAVLSLDWSSLNPNILLSSSADQSIKLWDLNKVECINTIKDYHNNKIQSIKLHKYEPNVLLSGSFDKTCKLCDIRNIKGFKSWSVPGEVESIIWNELNPASFNITLDNGYIMSFDSRKESSPIYSYKGHNKAATCMTFNKFYPQLFATGSLDDTIKLWDESNLIDNNGNQQPKLITTLESNLDAIFNCDFPLSQRISNILVIGGQTNYGIWDIMSTYEVRKYFNIKNYTDD